VVLRFTGARGGFVPSAKLSEDGVARMFVVDRRVTPGIVATVELSHAKLRLAAS
jgi:hypothetical protein